MKEDNNYVRVLRIAKERMVKEYAETRTSRGVCGFLYMEAEHPQLGEYASAIRERIMNSIRPWSYIGQYLREALGQPYLFSNEELFEYRCRWVDWMIEGYSRLPKGARP